MVKLFDVAVYCMQSYNYLLNGFVVYLCQNQWSMRICEYHKMGIYSKVVKTLQTTLKCAKPIPKLGLVKELVFYLVALM